MATDNHEVLVKLIDVEGIHGLIESLTEVADMGTRVVDAFEDYNLEDSDIAKLKASLLNLNDYVDEHLHDE